MNLGELALILGTIPFAVLVGIPLKSPLSAVAFYLSYLFFTACSMRRGKGGLRTYTINALLSLLLAILVGLL